MQLQGADACQARSHHLPQRLLDDQLLARAIGRGQCAGRATVINCRAQDSEGFSGGTALLWLYRPQQHGNAALSSYVAIGGSIQRLQAVTAFSLTAVM